MIETIVPRDEQHWLQLRAEDITSTETPALFGLSPYTTLFELWHRKKDKLVLELEPNERMKWGTRLQDAIANGIGLDQGWSIRHMKEYIRDPELRMGSSFDFEIETLTPYGENGVGQIAEKGLLEIKNVDSLAFRDGWAIEGDDLEAPPHIELQVQHQLAVSGRKFAYIGALIGGNRVALIKREPDEKIIKEIKRRVASFWLTVVMEQEPKPDFAKDAAFITRLYGYAEPNKVLDARNDEKFTKLMIKYKEAGDRAKQAEEEKNIAKAELLTLAGDAEKVLGAGFTLSLGIVGEAEVTYTRKAYRAFKPSWKKSVEKENG